MDEQINIISYADTVCEECGNEIPKGASLLLEADTPFCSEMCSDYYFERARRPKDDPEPGDDE